MPIGLPVSGPLDAQRNLQQIWLGSTLVIVEGEGHGGATMVEHTVQFLQELAK